MNIKIFIFIGLSLFPRLSQKSGTASIPPPTQPYNYWEFIEHYQGNDKIDRIHNSFTVGWRGNCTGTMISPHIYMTAAHCGGEFIDVQFFHINEDVAAPSSQHQQRSERYRGRPLPWQSFISHAGKQDGDTRFWWLEDGSDGIPPGYKYGYVDLNTDKVKLGDEAYSFWVNPVPNVGSSILYSWGDAFRLGPIGTDPPRYFSDYHIVSALGASGSTVINASNHQGIGTTAILLGNGRRAADTHHVLEIYDADKNDVLDAIEYDLLLTSKYKNFHFFDFQTPMKRSEWLVRGDRAQIHEGPGVNVAHIGAKHIGPSFYRAHWNSPWMDRSGPPAQFYLETFEDGSLNTLGVQASTGRVLGPGPNTDSVDNDDGQEDFQGTSGHSFYSTNGRAGIKFTFIPTQLGGSLPTRAGIVWTDGGGKVTFEAYDASGQSIGRIGPVDIGDSQHNGNIWEDSFFGVVHRAGISAIKIWNENGGIEVDHLQYGTRNPSSTSDALIHTNARFQPNTTYRFSAAIYGFNLNSQEQNGYLKFKVPNSNRSEEIEFTPTYRTWSRITGSIELDGSSDYQLMLGGSEQASYYLYDLTIIKEANSSFLDFQTGEERKRWEYIHGSYPTSWGIDGGGDFSAIVKGVSTSNPRSYSGYDWSIRNRYIGLEANKNYLISFDAQHISGDLRNELFARIEDLNGVSEELYTWRFTQNGGRGHYEFEVCTDHHKSGITFGALGSSTYMVDNIQISYNGPNIIEWLPGSSNNVGCKEDVEIVNIRGNRTGINNTTHSMSVDGTVSTYFQSSYDNWQYLQVDFGEKAKVSRFRRYMTRDGRNTSGNRGNRSGEGFSYSLDGIHWIHVTKHTSQGWENYINYTPHAWHSVAYGWSNWLTLRTPIYARYIRFNWDDARDAVNEIQITYE